MITFLVSSGHDYTHTSLSKLKFESKVSVLSYRRLFRRRALSKGTYIFTDFDRLNFWELKLAGEVYRLILNAGWGPLNDPARVRQRYALLRQLHRDGINRFGVYRVEASEMPERYPVFLRNECAHDGPLTGLLSDREGLLREIDRLVGDGHPEHHLLVVEYAAEPVEGVYRKYASFRIADRVFPSLCVHEQHWRVTHGRKGVAGQALYEEENSLIRENRHEHLLRQAFQLARIDYGRADFGIVEGRVQVYEINTNPTMGFEQTPHPFAARQASKQLARRYYLDALTLIDRAEGPRQIVLSSPGLRQRQRWRASLDSIMKTP
jgi:hypothetical protein